MRKENKCTYCFDGEHINWDEHEAEFDRIHDMGQFSAYEIFLQFKRQYHDGVVKCDKCNGTGIKPEEATTN